MPRGYPRSKNPFLETLARIAMNNGIDSKEFFSCLVNAWKRKKSACGNLVIECRETTRDSAIFLFTRGQRIVAQFPVPEHTLRGDNPLKGYTDNLSIGSRSIRRSSREDMKIKDLRPRMRNVNVKARIIEIPEPKPVYTRFGTQAYVSNALIADETGVIRLSLWNQQINMVSVDDVIKIEKAKVSRFRGVPQIRIGRSGKISVIEEPSFPTLEELKKVSEGRE